MISTLRFLGLSDKKRCDGATGTLLPGVEEELVSLPRQSADYLHVS